jgi:predicted O-methyltransferase YrrM
MEKVDLLDCVKSEEFTKCALTPESLAWIAQFIQDHNIRTITGAGSGLSTILLASMTKDNQISHALSLEHDPRWYEYNQLR